MNCCPDCGTEFTSDYKPCSACDLEQATQKLAEAARQLRDKVGAASLHDWHGETGDALVAALAEWDAAAEADRT